MTSPSTGSYHGGFGSPLTPPRTRTPPRRRGSSEMREPPVAPIERDLSGRMIRKAPVPTQQDLKASWESPSRRTRASPARARDSGNVKVMVRVRPFSDAEVQEAADNDETLESVVKCPKPGQCLLLDHTQNYKEKAGFNFDDVFWSNHHEQSDIAYSTQEQVYEASGKICLENAWDGFNSCIFAYGQTGSGKTHTMMGPPVDMASEAGCADCDYGVIPRLGQELFRQREERLNTAQLAGVSKQFEVIVTFFEIYNERVYDLVKDIETDGNGTRSGSAKPDDAGSERDRQGPARRRTSESPTQHGLESASDHSGLRRAVSSMSNRGARGERGEDDDELPAAKDNEYLRIREHPLYGPYVDGLTTYYPTNYSDLIALIQKGTALRHWAATKLNDRSSRSHAIFRITLQQVTTLNNNDRGGYGQRTVSSERRANINLVDLAGSENIKKSGAAGTTLVEAQKINLSLTTLRRVIDALIEKKQQVVPYRDSTLTWLLSQDLGGNSKTIMLATVSGHPSGAYESLRTLEYAMKARSIVNKVRANDQDETARLLAEIEKRYAEMHTRMMSMSHDMKDEGVATTDPAMILRSSSDPSLNPSTNDKAEREAEELKKQLMEYKEKSIQQAFRSACALNSTRARLRQQAEEKQEVVESVSELERKLVDHEENVSKLEREKADLEHRESVMKGREEQLLEALVKEREEKKRIREREMSMEQVVEENEEYQRNITALGEKISSLLVDQRFESEKVKRHHELHIAALTAEKEEVINRHKIALVELQNEYDNYRMETYSIRRELEDAALHDQRCRDDQYGKLSQQMALLETKYKESLDLLEVERVKNKEITTYYQKDIASYQESLKAYSRETDDLQTELKTSNADYLQQLKLMANLRFRVADILKKETAYEAVYEEVADILNTFQAAQGVLPEHMTFGDVRKLFIDFYALKRAYGSNRPNKEQLRQMLRTDPGRRGAERMRQLLDSEDAVSPPAGLNFPAPSSSPPGDHSTDANTVNVLMDVIKRCPDVSPHSPPPGSASHSPQRPVNFTFRNTAGVVTASQPPIPSLNNTKPATERTRSPGVKAKPALGKSSSSVGKSTTGKKKGPGLTTPRKEDSFRKKATSHMRSATGGGGKRNISRSPLGFD
eukprot:TRINITY_DN15359_c0_g1_i1.p1 TRINITY_DN15359_c0_g1~~TRINITY_DN15359_c0_g1_i1.p1  ORF type:complete len:1131 (+),score=428.82 TRINITY_DN15359_c0_g1_i1:129-3521(+)